RATSREILAVGSTQRVIQYSMIAKSALASRLTAPTPPRCSQSRGIRRIASNSAAVHMGSNPTSLLMTRAVVTAYHGQFPRAPLAVATTASALASALMARASTMPATAATQGRDAPFNRHNTTTPIKLAIDHPAAS